MCISWAPGWFYSSCAVPGTGCSFNALFSCAAARHASMLPGLCACVLPSGAGFLICLDLLCSPCSHCAVSTLLLCYCSFAPGWLFRPCCCQAFIHSFAACARSLILCLDCSFCCMRWMTSFVQLFCNGGWRLLLLCLVCFSCFNFHYIHLYACMLCMCHIGLACPCGLPS